VLIDCRVVANPGLAPGNLQLTEAQDQMFQKTAYAMSGFF